LSHTNADTDLVLRAIRGDTQAFGELYQRYLRQIYQYIYYRVGDQAEAEDMTETVFLKVWEALPNFRVGKASFSTWLYRVAHNLLVDRYRTQKTTLSLDSQPAQKIRDRAPSPEDEVIRQEEHERISAAIARLAPDYQQVLVLRFIEKLPHSEVARILDRSEPAVRVLQYRALRALADELGE